MGSAITWWFEQEEEGFFLDDGIMVQTVFFTCCAALLDQYRHDTGMRAIIGANFQDGQWRGSGSYYFSTFPHYWGRASWRRACRNYDADLSSWPAFRDSGTLSHLFPNAAELRFWASTWEQLHRHEHLFT